MLSWMYKLTGNSYLCGGVVGLSIWRPNSSSCILKTNKQRKPNMLYCWILTNKVGWCVGGKKKWINKPNLLKKRGLYRSVNTRRQGLLGANLEAFCHSNQGIGNKLVVTKGERKERGTN